MIQLEAVAPPVAGRGIILPGLQKIADELGHDETHDLFGVQRVSRRVAVTIVFFGRPLDAMRELAKVPQWRQELYGCCADPEHTGERVHTDETCGQSPAPGLPP